ncbi:hypothetical protein PR003_g24843 [Phytophthora rubi]|uniref:Uncharacterized protein n=1 Tax=Phytophthora rubi TaxID=129364 RepID=A0A6A3IBY4_9STRA|nr:hypothetical protein PR002_g24688 [Phytophthora rubi]KAE8980446.1 hypothetical protein PR001_g24273 [Phytophthora rubi]KAE9292110.1 hypothetical protein PR003_g24843 [Phytophthora rubi]
MNRAPRRPGEDGVERTCAQRHGEQDHLVAVPMESSGAEEQASESVDSAGVTIKTDESAEPVPGSEDATVVSGRSRVREAEESISELTQLLDNARKISAEFEMDELNGKRSYSAAIG